MEQIQELSDILNNPNELFADRHDAAITLGSFRNQKALDALMQVAIKNHQINDLEEQIVVEACGESIAKILVAMNKFDETVFARLHPYAQEDFKAYIQTNKPDWAEHL